MPEVLYSIDGDGCVVKDVETSNTASANLKPRDPDDIAVVDRAINGNAALIRPKNGKIKTVCLILNTMIGKDSYIKSC